jgi:hypothetical protein
MEESEARQLIKNEIVLALHWFCTSSLKWYEEVRKGKDSLLLFLQERGAEDWGPYFKDDDDEDKDDESMEEAIIEMRDHNAEYKSVMAIGAERLCVHPPCWRTSKGLLIEAVIIRINNDIKAAKRGAKESQ